MKEAWPKATSMPIRSFRKSIFAEGSPGSSKTGGWLFHPLSTKRSFSTSLNWGRESVEMSIEGCARRSSISCLITSLLLRTCSAKR